MPIPWKCVCVWVRDVLDGFEVQIHSCRHSNSNPVSRLQSYNLSVSLIFSLTCYYPRLSPGHHDFCLPYRPLVYFSLTSTKHAITCCYSTSRTPNRFELFSRTRYKNMVCADVISLSTEEIKLDGLLLSLSPSPVECNCKQMWCCNCKFANSTFSSQIQPGF